MFSYWQCTSLDNSVLEVSVSKDIATHEKGLIYVNVKCSSDWNLYLLDPHGGDNSWAKLSISSGSESRSLIKLDYEENNLSQDRVLNIVLTSGNKDTYCTFTQTAKPQVQPDPTPQPNPDPSPDPTPNPDPSPDPTPNPDPSPDPTPQPNPSEGKPANGQTHWLEMPDGYLVGGDGMYCVTHRAKMNGRSERNYTILYDSNMYTSYWVAYPLCQGHMGSGRKEDWQYDPLIPENKQTSVKGGYGGSISTPNYIDNFYARGHQLPNADRSRVYDMQLQTYHSTNLTPQIHHGFNEHIWAKLEAAARYAVKDAHVTDTVYIVTGATFNKIGENKTIKKIRNKNDGKMLPIPNYYWKVMLKVKRASNGDIIDAKTAAFWLPHEDLNGQLYIDYETTVDQIEAWTGFDFFVNLPLTLQQKSEATKEWYTFKNF